MDRSSCPKDKTQTYILKIKRPRYTRTFKHIGSCPPTYSVCGKEQNCIDINDMITEILKNEG